MYIAYFFLCIADYFLLIAELAVGVTPLALHKLDSFFEHFVVVSLLLVYSVYILQLLVL